MISIMDRSHHIPTTKSTLFVVSKDEWDTKEGTGKSTKNALQCTCAMAWQKAPLKLKQHQTVKKSSPYSLSHCQIAGV